MFTLLLAMKHILKLLEKLFPFNWINVLCFWHVTKINRKYVQISKKVCKKRKKVLRKKFHIFFYCTCGPRDLPVSPSRVRVIKRTPGVKFASLKTAIKTGFVRSVPLKGQCHEIFDFRFSTWISFPQAPDYTIRVVSNFFENSQRDIRSSRCTTGVVDTGGKWKKSSIRKIFIISFGHLWVVELAYRSFFSSSSF